MSIILANVCKFAIFDCPFICLFVGVFVYPDEDCQQDTGRTVRPIITKLDSNMHLDNGQKPIYFIGQWSNN